MILFPVDDYFIGHNNNNNDNNNNDTLKIALLKELSEKTGINL